MLMLFFSIYEEMTDVVCLRRGLSRLGLHEHSGSGQLRFGVRPVARDLTLAKAIGHSH